MALPYLTFVELFSGMRAWSKGMEMYGYDGVSCDTIYDFIAEDIMKCDFLTPMGFLCIVSLIMRIHRKGVFLAAIPCGSWVFMCRYTTGRHLNIKGFASNAWVRAQNVLVARLVYILILCIKRGVYFIIEQPWTSIVWGHARWQYLEKRFGHLIYFVEHDMGIYTLDVVKKSVLVGTAPYLQTFGKVLTPHGRQVVLNNPSKKQTAFIYIDAAGKQRICGGPDLKQTEHYSMAFGCRHAVTYKESCAEYAETPTPGLPLDPCDSDSEIGSCDEECFADFKTGFTTFEFTTKKQKTNSSPASGSTKKPKTNSLPASGSS